MFYGFDDRSVRLTGRWYKNGEDYISSTANGSKIDIAFSGERITLRFNITDNLKSLPHLWISVDDGIRVEVPVDAYISIGCKTAGVHRLKAVTKSSVETDNRWFAPLQSKVSFMGYFAKSNAELAKNNKKTIEFIGDSITEGVLVQPFYRLKEYCAELDSKNRPFQDDVTMTYAYVASEILGLEPLFGAYGAVGVTKGGCGLVPSAGEAYPYCFDSAPIPYSDPDYIVINHGTNDRSNKEMFEAGYIKLLDAITGHNPKSKVIAMIPFCGCFHDDIIKIVDEYNRKNGRDIIVIDTTDWIKPEPLHPEEDGHRVAGEKLAEELRRQLCL